MKYDGKKQISFWMDEDMYYEFMKKCDAEDKPKSRVLRRLVNGYLAEDDVESDETVYGHVSVDLDNVDEQVEDDEGKSWIKKILKK